MAKKKLNLSNDAVLIQEIALRAGTVKVYKSVEDDIIVLSHEVYGDIVNVFTINTFAAAELAAALLKA